MRAVAGLAVVLVVVAAAPRTASAGQEPWKPTAAELRSLPRYCQDRFRYGASRKHPVIARWYAVFGNDFVHIHHYCAGVNFLNRARGSFGDPKRRAFNYQRAAANLGYIIDRVSRRFPLLPAAYHHRGQALEGLGKPAEAVRDYLAAIEAKPDYPPPYAALAELHRRAGRRGEARAVLEKGLKANPRSRLLRRALARLERERAAGGRQRAE